MLFGVVVFVITFQAGIIRAPTNLNKSSNALNDQFVTQFAVKPDAGKQRPNHRKSQSRHRRPGRDSLLNVAQRPKRCDQHSDISMSEAISHQSNRCASIEELAKQADAMTKGQHCGRNGDNRHV